MEEIQDIFIGGDVSDGKVYLYEKENPVWREPRTGICELPSIPESILEVVKFPNPALWLECRQVGEDFVQ